MTHGLHGVGTPPQKLEDVLERLAERADLREARARWGGERK